MNINEISRILQISLFATKTLLRKDALSITTSLGKLKGTAMKVGQILSMVPGILPIEYEEHFRSLQSSAPPMAWPFVRRVIAAELGKDWEASFESFQTQASFAASLGQVHKAVLKSGETVAVKIQYPNMQDVVNADLMQIRFIVNILSKYSHIGLNEVLDEVAEALLDELNYKKESYNMLVYKSLNICNVPYVHMSTPKVIVMDWLDGMHIDDIFIHDQAWKNKAGAALFQAWYWPLYVKCMLHSDPHPGNYSFNESAEVNLLDFGCFRYFDRNIINGIINIYHGILSNKSCKDGYRAIGFDDPSDDLEAILNVWAKFIFAPFLIDQDSIIPNDPKNGVRLAKDVYDMLKKQGKTVLPKTFVFLDRTGIGIGAALIKLKAKNNWYHIFNSMLEKIDEINRHPLPFELSS